MTKSVELGKGDLEEVRATVLPKMIKVIVLQSVALVVITLGLVLATYLAVTKKPQVLAVTDTGRVIPVVPLDKPYVGDSRVIGFADECVRMAFSHDFLNFRQTLGQAKTCFTGAGGSSFDAAIEPLIKGLERDRMIMSTTLRPAVIVKTASRAGVHIWVLQTKMTLFREGTKESVTPATYVVDIVVERVPLEESVRGIAVSQINVRPG